MSTSNWITIIIALVSFGGMLVTGSVKWGGLIVRLGTAEAALAALVRGHEKRGERLGVVEERVAAIEGSMGPMAAPAPPGRARTRSRAMLITPAPADDDAGEGGA